MPFALITGASRGIGRALALEFARRGYGLLLVARSADTLAALAAEAQAQHGVSAAFLALDLTAPDAATRVATWADTTAAGELSVLVNNAGYGLWGRFAELPLAEQQNMLQLNMLLPVNLTHALLPLLRRQPQAYILNVASTAAYQAVPTLALYAASKAFLLTFTRGLRYELHESAVSVSCLSPGATATAFADRAGMNAAMQETSARFAMSAEEVAQAGVVGLLSGEAEIIPGALNKLSAKLTGVMPKRLTEKIAAGLYEKHLKQETPNGE
ncbi:SDR family oxidoreductase [Hymenobacter busanensis]|uniref:SDR family oxidoreductase n=1 Tax=Hymenobacter busanensis TaxID=2607656 RepID=A0A7L4ZY64_9BACT|nr:SDR family oxidoreductase [Hymenobacter busanensis]KAA9333157.1 SDR family oxidoreductase [Hymenobacter busanensis]QHJ08168.1 SDR family NAD(P)-dependent oxidoreductase [Hymenobacter busanensis]